MQLLSFYIVNRLTFLILTKTEVGKKKEKSSKKVEDKIDLAVLKKGKGGKREMHSVSLMYLDSFTRVCCLPF